jgi:predicted ATPase
LWIGRGQCIEHYGAGEAYLPVLEALGRLCREPGSERLIELLSQHAPTWLVQMPALLSPAELEVLQRKVLGATRERMLREMAEAVEALTAERGLVLRFEDLHWSDYSTLDLISYLARRQERARLLMIGTYRPVEVLGHGHPLRAVTQELQLHGDCAELPVRWLTEAAVAEYLAVRFGVEARHRPGFSTGQVPLQSLAQVIHRHTEGNPLFMINVVEHVMARGALVQVEGRWVLRGGVEEVAVGVPENLRQMIEKHLDRLSPEEQRVLEVASVAGMEFSAAAVAAGVEAVGDEVEERCAELARRGQFLQARGLAEWPDGTVAARYGFIHALYQEVVYERVPAGRRVHLHRRIGEREEVAYDNRAGEIAAELAVHFERGRDYHRAVHYLQQTGENAARRHAYREAIDHLTKGIELLKVLPDTPERLQKELLLQTTLGPALIATKGQAAPEVGKVYARAYELCQQEGESSQIFTVSRGLRFFYLARREFQTAYELSEQLLRLAQRLHDPALLLEAHHALGALLFWLGEFASAQKHFEQGLALYDPPQHHTLAVLYGYDPGVACLLRVALVLWCLGYPDQALQRCHDALTLAQQEASHPLSSAYILHHAAWLHQFRREGLMTQERAEAVITVSSEQGFALYLAMGTILWGWALTEQGQREEGIAQMRRGLAAWRGIGNELLQPYYLALLAEAYGKVGQAEEGLSALSEALTLVNKTGERVYEAELYRLKGTLTLQQFNVQGSKFKVANIQSLTPNPQAEAEVEACFLKAIEIARRQQAKSWELRATTSLSQLWRSQGKKKEAHKILANIYNWFTEGFDTKDLQEAKALLAELSCNK